MAEFPHSQMCSAPNAAAERTIIPTLNGWVTESSSRATRAPVARRQDRLSRFTSVGRSCLGGAPAGGASSGCLRPGHLVHGELTCSTR